MKIIRASGAIFYSIKTGRVMLCMRSGSSFSDRWGFVGGKLERGENILQGLEREIKEEIGFLPPFYKVYPFDHFVSRDERFEYSSMVIFVWDEFIPKLNYENSGYCWVMPGNWPRPLHPGAKACFEGTDLVRNLESIRKKLLLPRMQNHQ